MVGEDPDPVPPFDGDPDPVEHLGQSLDRIPPCHRSQTSEVPICGERVQSIPIAAFQGGARSERGGVLGQYGDHGVDSLVHKAPLTSYPCAEQMTSSLIIR
jgi:hypothetical protein